jgi:hypothetical protein
MQGLPKEPMVLPVGSRVVSDHLHKRRRGTFIVTSFPTNSFPS